MEASTSSSESMDISESSSLGDGGEEGDIIPEKSVVYAALEVCLCVISRQIPALNPSAPSTGFQVPTRLTKISDENCSLVASMVLILADLPNLCSKNGTLWGILNLIFAERIIGYTYIDIRLNSQKFKCTSKEKLRSKDTCVPLLDLEIQCTYTYDLEKIYLCVLRLTISSNKSCTLPTNKVSKRRKNRMLF